MDCPHLLAHHPLGMGNAPLTCMPLQDGQTAGIEAGLLALQAMHGLLACKERGSSMSHCSTKGQKLSVGFTRVR